jgi:hypothetical protein
LVIVGGLNIIISRSIFMKYVLPLGLGLIGSYCSLDTLESYAYSFAVIKIILPRGLWLLSICSLAILKTSADRRAWIYMNLILYQKPMGGTVLTMAYVLLETSTEIDAYLPQSILPGIRNVLIGQLLFFTTGHQSIMPSIQYELGFVGLYTVNWILTPIFIALNTYGGPLLASIYSTQSHFPAIAGTMTSSLIFSGWFMRHSQSWRVWGPKFLFITGGFSLVSTSLLIQKYCSPYIKA